MEYTFTLKYQLADDDHDPNTLVEHLGEAGCDDALVGIGQPGRLALEFIREADSADAAMRSALADVQSAVPSARLIEVTPDLVGLTDVAERVGVSRQNMRKLMLAHPSSFPVPVHEGSTSIWHLADVLTWLQTKGNYSFAGQERDGCGASGFAGERGEGKPAPATLGVQGVISLLGLRRAAGLNPDPNLPE